MKLILLSKNIERVKVLVPKNSALREYREKALKMIGVPDKKITEVRGEDIPFLLEEYKNKGKKAIGLTGEDLFKEYTFSVRFTKVRVLKRIEWKDKKAMFGKPTLCLLGPKNSSLEGLPKELKVCINYKYKLLAKRYLNFLERKMGFNFRKIYTKGTTETTYSEGLSDLVIDIVYTGASIKKAGLRVYEKIFSSDFVILGGGDDKA
ncbi:MAG: hypothetical protein V3U72_00720 [Candidatus Aenigmarchaeota archaeon]